MNWFLPVIFFLLINFTSSAFWDKGCTDSQTECRLNYSDKCCNSMEECIWDTITKGSMCIRPAKLGSICTENADCRAILDAKCSENGTCICKHGLIGTNNYFPCATQRISNPGNFTVYGDFVCNGSDCTLPADFELASRGGKDSELMYGEKCDSDDDCKRYNLSTTVCINSQCRCRSGELFAYEDLACRPSKNGLGLPCSWNDKCADPNSYCDDFKTCRCKRFYYYKNGACVFDWNYECPEDYYFNVKKQKCSRYVREEGHLCSSDESCERLIGSTCVFGFCQCSLSTKYHNGTCVVPISSNCDSSKDCNVTHSDCIDGRCDCIGEHYASESETQCLPFAEKLHDPCGGYPGCKNLLNTLCNGTHCVCHRNAIEKNGTCFPLVYGSCSETVPCQSENATCTNGQCRCLDEDDYYTTEDNLACYKVADKVGESCKSDQGCRKFGRHSTCSEGICVCKRRYAESRGLCLGIHEAMCYEDSECISGFSCINEECYCPEYAVLSDDGMNCNINPRNISCPENYHFYPPHQNCSRYAKAMDDYCSNNIDCDRLNITNVECVSSTCQCREKYRYYNGTCILPIGARCDWDINRRCTQANSTCDYYYDYCHCIEGHYSAANGTVCLPYAKELDDTCNDEDACGNIENAMCSEDNKCVCQSNYIEIDRSCKSIIGGRCQLKADCSVEYSVCDRTARKCKCRFRYAESQDKRSCLPYKY